MWSLLVTFQSRQHKTEPERDVSGTNRQPTERSKYNVLLRKTDDQRNYPNQDDL